MPEIARRVHANIQSAVWATLIAFVIYLITFVLPKLPETQAHRARIRIEEIGKENTSLCEQLASNAELTATTSACLMLVSFDGKSKTVPTMRSPGSNAFGAMAATFSPAMAMS